MGIGTRLSSDFRAPRAGRRPWGTILHPGSAAAGRRSARPARAAPVERKAAAGARPVGRGAPRRRGPARLERRSRPVLAGSAAARKAAAGAGRCWPRLGQGCPRVPVGVCPRRPAGAGSRGDPGRPGKDGSGPLWHRRQPAGCRRCRPGSGRSARRLPQAPYSRPLPRPGCGSPTPPSGGKAVSRPLVRPGARPPRPPRRQRGRRLRSPARQTPTCP